jgi:phage baseplate assembly protein W
MDKTNYITSNNYDINYVDLSPRFSNGILSGYDKVLDDQAVQNSLKNLFTISQGEVPGKPWLGNPLNIFLFDNIGKFEEQAIKAAFINIIEKYEPRVKIIDISLNSQPEYNTINISLYYSLLTGGQDEIDNYRFSLNYNNLTNITLRDLT